MTATIRERIREIDNAVSVELRALNALDAHRQCVFVLVCMDCERPYAAHLVHAGDSARIAASHGICDTCNEDRELAELDRQKAEAKARYDAHTWTRPE